MLLLDENDLLDEKKFISIPIPVPACRAGDVLFSSPWLVIKKYDDVIVISTFPEGDSNAMSSGN